MQKVRNTLVYIIRATCLFKVPVLKKVVVINNKISYTALINKVEVEQSYNLDALFYKILIKCYYKNYIRLPFKTSNNT